MKITRTPQGYRFGECHHRSKLSDKTVALMRWLYVPGKIGYEQLAELCGCSPSTARNIVNLETR